jgi:triphosphoribosyl-dephospho-CoA synthase
MARSAAGAERLAREGIRAAYLTACRAELQALKPGNVHVFAPGHGMTVADFEASAEASADAIADPRLAVGRKIYRAVRLSHEAAGCNTNLGIILLCAPLAQAAVQGRGRDFRGRLASVLRHLDRADAAAAFRAIALADPAGLGSSDRHDVRRPARVTLLTAMVEARGRDRIARQYATGFADIFGIGLGRLDAARARWGDGPWAVSATFMAFLAGFRDSHVRRKHGARAAADLRRRAQQLDGRLMGARGPETLGPALLAFDAALKREGINPGTSADLTVATLFAAGLQRMLDAA